MELDRRTIFRAQTSMLIDSLKSHWRGVLFISIFLIPILYSSVNQASKTGEKKHGVVLGGGVDASSDMAIPQTVLKFELENEHQGVVWSPPGTPIYVGRKIELDVYKRVLSGSIEYRFNRYAESSNPPKQPNSVDARTSRN